MPSIIPGISHAFVAEEAGLFRVENETVVQLKAFVEEKFPNSTYAPYVKLAKAALGGGLDASPT